MPCSFPNCPNSSAPLKRNVSFFRYPDPSKNPQLFQAWASVLNPPANRGHRAAVCELHFNEADYDESYKMKRKLMPHEYFKPLLKPTAVPKRQLQAIEKPVNEEKNEELVRRLLKGRTKEKIKKKIEAERKEELEKIRQKQAGERQGQLEAQGETNSQLIFQSTTDYIMQMPLKPLPDALQRVLPSFLGVVITKISFTPSNSIPSEQPPLFSCSEPLQNSDLYKCRQCGYSSFVKLHLIHHISTAHRPICSPCVTRYPMKTSKPPPTPKYHCWHCEFTTFSKLMFFRHIYTVTDIRILKEIKWFRCVHCSFRSVLSCAVKHHIQDVHKKKSFKF